MSNDQTVTKLIQNAYECLKALDAEGAAAVLNKALELTYNNEEAKHALKCVNWWLEHTAPIKKMENHYEKGGFILSNLKQYYSYLENLEGDYELCQYAIRRYVFSLAISCFKDILGDGVNQYDPGLLLLIGRCYKGIGNYDEAMKYLKQAVRFKREDGETLAELADVNALLGENTTAKALFREAFFLSPEKIELRAMESEMVLKLRDKLQKEKKFNEEELREWMPVYGKLWGVFTVSRELKPIEFGRLKQSILSLETECQGNPGQKHILKPRLINRYFWLLDYYERINEDRELIEEVLLKIKLTDQEIYERYIR